MKLFLYDTRTRSKREFVPISEGKVGMYHCGPTVYQRPHIGNYRAFLFADLLRRVFEVLGYEVHQIMNLTDVGHLLADAEEGEDKLEAQAKKDNVDPWQIVDQVSKQFFADLNELGIQPAHAYPRATEYIDEMVEIIEVLIDKGHAYKVGSNVYFDVHSFSDYGRLSGNNIADLEAGARLEVNPEKRHPADFALWKTDKNHLMKWDTSFGTDGFPGWHIECSAMSRKFLGDHFDIHTGGEDNVFPHHECEIAQSECAHDGRFVNYWMHTKFLQVDGGKMSKSLANVYSIDDLIERGFCALDFRFLMMRGHYRSALNFTFEALQGAAEARKNLCDFMSRLQSAAGHDAPDATGCGALQTAQQDFYAALADDLNTSAAIAAVFTLRSAFMKEGFASSHSAATLEFMQKTVQQVFGDLNNEECSSDAISDAEVNDLIARRTQARTDKDWAMADIVRDQLSAAGIVVEDTADGIKWHRA
ncbi:MAG: cysteine--tRNA ligase [Planctomycetes bacterium]|nr:cysteine--tRNA ligase [Planctomycetota bacterium]